MVDRVSGDSTPSDRGLIKGEVSSWSSCSLGMSSDALGLPS